MPASRLTLLDIAKLNGNDKVVGLIEENLRYAPEMDIFPTRTIRGTQYTTGVRTSFPGVGFRSANDGFTASKSVFDKRLVEAFIFGGAIQFDKAVGLAYEDGLAAMEMIEASGVVKASMQTLGSQIWYGVSADTKGFAGVKAATPVSGAGSAHTINAAGTTANTASSVYALKFGIQDVQLISGQGGSMQLSDFRDQQITGVNGGVLAGRVADMLAWIGLQIGNVNCVGRIANLTADSGKGLTDLLLADLVATFPVGYMPDAIFMSRRSRGQLQKTRTVTLFGNGTNRPDQSLISPLPSQYDGIPIYVSESILNTDAIET